MNYRFFITVLLLLLNNGVFAEGLYTQQLSNTLLTTEQIEDSKKKLAEHKELVLHEELKIASFHRRGQLKASLEHSSCTGCHLSPPHTKSERTRTFMNMHTQFIACETCHFRPKDKQLSYQWEDTRDGLVIKGKTKLFRQVTSADENSKTRATALHNFYKITPFYQKESVVLRKEGAFNQETQQIGEKGTQEEKVHRRALIHAPLEEKGPECSACHDEKNDFLDLASLGASTYQQDKIYNNMIAQFFARYKDKDSRIRIMSILQ